MQLPQFNSPDRAFSLLQTAWAQILNQLTNRQQNLTNILQNTALITGSNTVFHGLGKPLQGWRMTRIRALATIYDDQENNPTPENTIILVASAPVTIDLEVF